MRRMRAGLVAAAGSVSLAALVCAPFTPWGLASTDVVAVAATTTTKTSKPPTTTRPSATKPSATKPFSAPPTNTPASALGSVTASQQCNPPKGLAAARMTTVPWPQQRFDLDRVWKITEGEGVTVATVDSGVQASHPQLAGVQAYSVLGGSGEDCLGHGTAVMGIIGAKDMRNSNGIPFVGMAPKANLISVQYTNQDSSQGADPNLAKAIRKAVELKAKVINVSSQSPPSDDLLNAVKYAQQNDVLIVAAAGNTDPRQKDTEQPIYPADYPGVLSVGAVGADGNVTDFSNTQSKVLVSAPGSNIPTTWPGGYDLGDSYTTGTSFAAPFVAGEAALIRSYKKNLSYQQVIHRIVATADGDNGTGGGQGMINPYSAVTALLDDNAPLSTGPATVNGNVARPIQIAGPPPVDHRTRDIGAAVAGGAVLSALAVGFAGVVIPLGRRRGWVPGRAVPLRGDD